MKICVWLLWEAAQLLTEGQCENSSGKGMHWAAASTQTIFLVCKSAGWNSPASCSSKPCTQIFVWLRATRAGNVLHKVTGAGGWRGPLGGPCAAGDKACWGAQLSPRGPVAPGTRETECSQKIRERTIAEKSQQANK